MAFALPYAAQAITAAAPAAAASAPSVSLMAIAKNVLMNVAISAAMTALQPQVGTAGKTFEWTLDPNAPIPFAAGRVGVAGTIAHLETYGPDKMYYGFVSVLSGAGPIKSFQGFKGDDEVVTFDGDGKAITSQWAGEMWLRTRPGAQPDTALTNPPGLKGGAQLPNWGAGYKLSGNACYMLVLGENSKRTAYPTGEVKPIVTIEGLFGWDPRQDSTYPGGAGACRLNDPSTWVWLDNPILWGLKWALGLWAGPVGKGAPGVDYQVGGIGSKVEGIDVAAFVAAANVADANGWKVAAYPTTDDDKSQVLDSFLQAGGAIYSQRAGKISCIQRAAPRASVVTISAADTAGPLEIDTAASRIDRINTIRPRFWSEAHRWQMTAIDEVTAAPYRTEDGAVRPRGIDYAYVPLANQAAQLAALQIANTREGIAGTIPLKPHMRNIAPGTAFTITEPGFLLDGLKCLCLNSDYDPMTGIVSVTFVSETDAKYPFALGQSTVPPVPGVLTPADNTVTPPQPGDWSLASTTFTDGGVTIPALLLTGEVENARAQSVIFEFRTLGAADWTGVGTEDPTAVRKEITGLTAGTQYEAAVSYRVGGLISNRLVLGPVTAGTLTAGDVAAVAPANIAGTPSLSISTVINPDGTQVSRLSAGCLSAAGAASYIVQIDDGLLAWTETAAVNALSNRVVRTGPTYRVRFKAVSRTGVLSAAWSGWSAYVVAAGDVTPPAQATAFVSTALARRVVWTFTPPADEDYSHLRVFRNSVGAIPGVGETPYAARVTGTVWTDTSVVAGVEYTYHAQTVDRTGNASAIFYMGQATPSYIRLLGGDVSASDGDLVTVNGTAAAIIAQTAWATYGGSINRIQYFSDAGVLDNISRIATRPLSGLTGRTADQLSYIGGGGLTVENLRPGEAGANITETRTAASIVGQGQLATQSAITAVQAPYATVANSFPDEDFNSSLIGVAGGGAFDTSAETTTTLGVIRSIKSPDGAGKAPGSQNQFTTYNTALAVGVAADGYFRFTAKTLVKAGFTGMLRGFLYFTGPTGAVVGPPTVLTFVDRRAVAQVATTAYNVDQQVLVPAGAVRCYFAFFVDWSTPLANAGYALVAKPGIRFVTDYPALTADAVRFSSGGVGGNVRRANGTTVVNDVDVITGSGNAAGILGQGGLATRDWVATGSHVRDSAGLLVLESRIINDMGVSAGVKFGGLKQFSNGQSSPMGAQPLIIEATDGQVVTYDTPYGVAPSIVPLTESLDALAASEYYLLTPTSPSGSGFTARARRVNPGTGAVYTTRLDDGAANRTIAGDMQSAERQKALSGVAYNERYTAIVTAKLRGAIVDFNYDNTPATPVYGSIPVTVSLYGRQTSGAAWVLMGSTTVASPSTNTLTDYTISIVGMVAWSTWNVHANTEYRVVITQNGSSTARYIVDFVSVTYEEQTSGSAASNVSALSGGRKVKYQITPLDG